MEKDGLQRFGFPVYGLLTKGNDELQNHLLQNNLNYVFGGQPVETWNGECIPTKEDYDRLRKTENLLVNVPWGRNNGRQVERVLMQLKLQGCQVKGIVITEGDDKFVKAYYAVERKKSIN